MIRKLFVFLIIILPGLMFFGFAGKESQNTSFLIQEKEKTVEPIIIFATGDIMLDRGVEYMINKYGNSDFKFPFLKIADDFKKADILFGNLESVISDKGKKIGSIYSFRAKPQALEGLKYAGFDFVSVANNHIFDYGMEAMEDSFKRLKEAGIDYVGGGFNEKEAFSARIKEIKNTKIGFLAYNSLTLGSKFWRAKGESSGIAIIGEQDLEKVKKDIESAKKEVDILIVSFHWGDEYMPKPNSFQVSFSKAIIDAGADLIIGHHPHVVQPVEKYNQGWIAYSLGNFVFDQGFSEETMKGLLLEVIIEEKKIKEVVGREIKISNSFQPSMAY